MEIGVSEEEKGDFKRGVFGGEVEVGMGGGKGDGAVEELDVIDFVGGGDVEGLRRRRRREDAWGHQEQDW